MRTLGLGRVVVSKDSSLKLGDFVTGLTGVQDYAVVSAKNLNQIDPGLVPLPRYLNVLGFTDLTAYFSLLEVGQLKFSARSVTTHELATGADCSGCLIIEERGDVVDLRCDSCGAVVDAVPIDPRGHTADGTRVGGNV